MPTVKMPAWIGLAAAPATALLLVAAAPPYNLWPLALIGLIPLYLALRSRSGWHAFGLSWLMGLIGHLLGLWWFIPFFDRFTPFGNGIGVGLLLLNCAYQALGFALWGWGCSWLERRWGLSWLISAPLLIVLVETLIPYFFQYYLSITLTAAWPLLQPAEIGGPAAVSAWLVLVNLTLAELGRALWLRRRPTRSTLAAAAIALLILGTGLARAAQVGQARTTAPVLRVGIVQANFGITSVQDREQRGSDYLATLRQSTETLAQQGADFIFWGESVWPYLWDQRLQREYPAEHPWALRPAGPPTRLLIGALTHTFGTAEIYNSAVLINNEGIVSGRYDKNYLVPISEYIPEGERFPAWRDWAQTHLPDWPQLTAGKGAPLLIDGDLRLGVAICSEDLNAPYIRKIARQNPNLLAVVASDAWFGTTAATPQHLALSIFRAIETRRDMVRATNSGQSAIVDATGQILTTGPVYEIPHDQPLPPTLLQGEVRLLEIPAAGPWLADYFPWLCLVALGLAALQSNKFRAS